MSEPSKFDRERERTPYQGQRTPDSGKRRGFSIWSMLGLVLFLLLLSLLVFNAWEGPDDIQRPPGPVSLNFSPVLDNGLTFTLRQDIPS